MEGEFRNEGLYFYIFRQSQQQSDSPGLISQTTRYLGYLVIALPSKKSFLKVPSLPWGRDNFLPRKQLPQGERRFFMAAILMLR